MKNLMKQITKNGRIFWVTYFTFFLIFGNANACMGIC